MYENTIKRLTSKHKTLKSIAVKVLHMSVCALTGGSGVRKAALLQLHGMQWLSTRTWEITLMT